MKIPKADLFRATDAQLSAIGVRRYGNKGWLRSAASMDLTEQELQVFYQIGANRPRKKQRRAQPQDSTVDLFSPQTPEEYANELYEANRDEFT